MEIFYRNTYNTRRNRFTIMYENIYCFAGNPYLIRAKVRLWKEKFLEKHQNTINVVSLTYEREEDTDVVVREVESLPFLSPFKLVFIHRFLDTKREEGEGGENSRGKERFKRVEDACDRAPDTSIIVFISPVPDKRRSLFKKIPPQNMKTFRLDRHLIIHGFDDSNVGIPLVDFFLSQSGNTIPRETMEYLIQILRSERQEEGIDLFMLHHELEKLLSYGQGNTITREMVDIVVPRVFGSKIFAFTDALGRGNAKQAITVLDTLLEQGDDIHAFWGLLMGHFHRLLGVKTLLVETKPLTAIRAFLGNVAFKSAEIIEQATQFDYDDLTHIYRMLLEIDIRLKTGGITITTTDIRTFQLAIERFIFLVSSRKYSKADHHKSQ